MKVHKNARRSQTCGKRRRRVSLVAQLWHQCLLMCWPIRELLNVALSKWIVVVGCVQGVGGVITSTCRDAGFIFTSSVNTINNATVAKTYFNDQFSHFWKRQKNRILRFVRSQAQGYSVIQCHCSHSVCARHPLCSPVWFHRSALPKWSINYRRQNQINHQSAGCVPRICNKCQDGIKQPERWEAWKSGQAVQWRSDTLKIASVCSCSSGLASHIPTQQYKSNILNKATETTHRKTTKHFGNQILTGCLRAPECVVSGGLHILWCVQDGSRGTGFPNGERIIISVTRLYLLRLPEQP